jgi:hypothetical protein
MVLNAGNNAVSAGMSALTPEQLTQTSLREIALEGRVGVSLPKLWEILPGLDKFQKAFIWHSLRAHPNLTFSSLDESQAACVPVIYQTGITELALHDNLEVRVPDLPGRYELCNVVQLTETKIKLRVVRFDHDEWIPRNSKRVNREGSRKCSVSEIHRSDVATLPLEDPRTNILRISACKELRWRVLGISDPVALPSEPAFTILEKLGQMRQNGLTMNKMAAECNLNASGIFHQVQSYSNPKAPPQTPNPKPKTQTQTQTQKPKPHTHTQTQTQTPTQLKPVTLKPATLIL